MAVSAVRFLTLLVFLVEVLLPGTTAKKMKCKCGDIIDCSDLGIGAFEKDELPCNRHITRIDLSYNFLRTYPDDVYVFHFVNISQNRLRSLESNVDQRVDVLDVSSNSIMKIDLSDKFYSLRRLYASNNMFSHSAEFIRGYCNIHVLDVSDSMVESLDSVIHCPALLYLVAPQNEISEIPEKMSLLKRLAKLHLSHNKLVDVSGFPKSLEELDLSFNEIRVISLSSFEGLSLVKNIDLKYNKIVTIWDRAFVGLKSLVTLDLSHNMIKSLSDNALEGLKSLETIILKDNQLESISEGAFENLPNLGILQLGNNLLTKVPALRLDPSVTKVSLSFNDIRRVDDVAVITILSGPATKRNLLLVANPIRGDDPGVQNLIDIFAAACSESLENSTRKLIEEWRLSYNFSKSSSYRDFGRLAYSPCPCAGISMENAVLKLCVSEAAAGWSGQHWLTLDQLYKEEEEEEEDTFKDEL